ncbi:MAG: serine hydrolase [Bacteroidia bacterium]|nr:serine hydrolase [Bacteroidia bacterium]
MLQAKEGLLILAIPLLLGGILLAMSNLGGEQERAPSWYSSQYEFTIWTDTVMAGEFRNVPVVHLSDREAARASMLVLQNQKDLLPIGPLGDKRFGLLMLGRPTPVFEAYLSRYTQLDTVVWQGEGADVTLRPFTNCSHIIVAVNQSIESAYSLKALVEKLEKKKEVLLTCFDSYQLLTDVSKHHSIVLAPNHYQVSQEAAAQLIFGGQASTRGLPDHIAAALNIRTSYITPKTRLGYSDPEYVGMSSDTLATIDEIIAEGIREFAMPGCQVLVAREGQIVYHKSFGYHTYQQEKPVRMDDLYDLASITKVAATTLASMKMVEQGKLSIDKRIGDYLTNRQYQTSRYWVTDTLTLSQWKSKLGKDSTLANTDVRPWLDSLVLIPRIVRAGGRNMRSKVFDITLEQLLTHSSGLQASLDIYPYQRFLRSVMYDAEVSDRFSVPVAQNFYLDRSYLDSLWNDTKALLPDSSSYRYSCVNMILLQRVIDSINQVGIQDYLDQEFYRDLGLQTLGFNPLDRFSKQRIVPTASDRWRGQLLCGTVHDPTAALFGGVSGNAGLFSNAHDLGILGQLWLNQGKYGGKRFLEASTVETFTQRTRGHRGLGFDMPPRNGAYLVAESSSLATYGHTGFTGTCIWIDPENDLVFVFLSNRVHPSVSNNRINELRIRQRVHQAVYRAMGVPADPRRIPGAPDLRELDDTPMIASDVVLAP